MRRHRSPFAQLAVLLVVGAVLSACAQSDYNSRRDAVTFAAGNAMAHNRAIHAEDPWPAGVEDTAVVANGPRMQRAVKSYQEGPPADAPSTSDKMLEMLMAGAEAEGQ